MGTILDEDQRSISYYGVLVIVSLLALFNGGIDHPVVYWSFFVAVIAVGYQLYKNDLELDFSFRSPFLWYSLFCSWSGISIVWSVTPHWTVVGFIKLILYMLVFLLATKISELEINKLIRMIFLLAIGLVSLGILKYLFVSQDSLQSTFYNPNPFGVYLAMVFCFKWALDLRTKQKSFNFGVIILLIGLFLSGSRGSMIAFFVSLPLLFIGLKGKELYQSIFKTVSIVIVALIMVQIIVVSAPYLQENIEMQQLSKILIDSEGFISSSVAARLKFWDKAVQLFSDKPLTGYGLGSYHVASYLKYEGGVSYSRFVHNYYLQILSDVGVMGAILFVGFLVSLLQIAWKKIRSQQYSDYLPGLLAALLAFLLHIGVDFSWNFSAVGVLFFVGIGILIANDDDNSAKKQRININKRVSLTMLLILLVIGLAPFVSDKLSNQGYRLLLQGKTARANSKYKLASKIYPINPQTDYFISKNYLRLFNNTGNKAFLNKSLTAAKSAVDLSPIQGEYHNHLGKIYWRLGNEKQAEEHLAQGVEYGSYLINRYLDLGYFYYQQGQVDSAIRILQQGVQLKKDALIAAKKSYKRNRKEKTIEALINTNSLLAKIYEQENKSEKVENRKAELEKLKVMKDDLISD
ncbi:MAG: O-antigen ligase family protein [Bacillota bacterium]